MSISMYKSQYTNLEMFNLPINNVYYLHISFKKKV